MSVYLKSQKIVKEWVDYNNHLNMAYYVLIFDQAWEIILNKFKMDKIGRGVLLANFGYVIAFVGYFYI